MTPTVYDFSLRRADNRFRFRPEHGDEITCSRIAGQIFVLSADGRTGHLKVYGKVKLDHDVVYCWLPDDAVNIPTPLDNTPQTCPVGYAQTISSDFSTMPKGNRHWRLCYSREGQAWRLRDEASGRVWLVSDYIGSININWFDGGTHIFHDGGVSVDQFGVAHFEVPDAPLR